uniref:RING-type E3 ubiquitin transferase n=1 Tax=Kalmanozyma brasiliensis (strain GHG001) TaxID=1365824 RepID=V5EZI6_KALBG
MMATRNQDHHDDTNESSIDEPTSAAGAPIEPVPTEPQSNTVDDDDDELPPEGELCFICADPIKLTSVAPCDHRTCHICALRLRVLYKKDECTFCKTKIERLIFTSSTTKPFADFKPSDIPYTDKKLPISFETKEALEETVLLLRFNCPDPNCEVACTGWKDFKAHVRREHNRLVCQLCITNKKIFAHEHTLHTEQSLAAHEKAEHRLCEYDRLLFYSDDELFAHMRDKHEQCHICKARGSEEERWKYYRDYDMLEKHFRKDHWLCENKTCLDEKFQVFENEMDFKAHQLDRHGNELSTREKREALRIEANFSYDDGGVESSRSGANRGAGKKSKGRANGATEADAAPQNRDVLGVSALASRSHVPGAGPANHASRRAMFGSGLTTPAPPQGVSADRPRTVTDSRSIEERHQAYMDKVSSTLQSESRITSFRHSVRVFKNGESSARDLISTIHSLVGEMDDCAPLVNGLMDLLDDANKSKALSDAWNGYRIERTQFPSLTPASSSTVGLTPGTGYAGAGARGTNLRSIKRSSAASSSQVWANVERAASASSGHGAGKPVALREHFPSLSTPSSGTPTIPGSLAHAVAHGAASRAAAPAAKWSAASTAVSSGASTPRPFVARVHSSGRSVNTKSNAAFPSLPSNASKSAINAQRKALFASKSGEATPAPGGSGSSTPAPWLAGQGQPGRIDDFPEIAAGGQGLGSLDGLSEALVASQEAGGRKKKGKGVQMMTFGGVHRG